METLLPWWGWMLAGAGVVALIWLLAQLIVSGPARRTLARDLEDARRNLAHLEAQRADREARVLSLEQRLTDSEHMRGQADRALAENEAVLATLRGQLIELDRLRAEAASLRERQESMAQELADAQLRAAEAVAARAELERERGALRAEAAAAASLGPEAERLRASLAEARWELALRAAQIRLAEGEREAAALTGLVSRAWRRRDADLAVLSALNGELSELRDALYRARRRIDELRREPRHDDESIAAAAEVEAQITARAEELRELAGQSGLLDRADEGEVAALDAAPDALPSAAGAALGGVFSYLRETFGRLPSLLAPAPSPIPEPPATEDDAAAEPVEAVEESPEPERERQLPRD
jgi:chromosome segregation protein